MLLGIPWTEWLGYAASLVVAISLLMKSLIRLRWINLAGSALFAVYGFLIGAYPVGGFNVAIILINIIYLVRIYRTTESFELLVVQPHDTYLPRFLMHHSADIAKFFPGFDIAAFLHQEDLIRTTEEISLPPVRRVAFYILRDLVTVGLFIGSIDEAGNLTIELDYVIPAYRDFKPGEFLFTACRDKWRALGASTLVASANGNQHAAYLARMGFTPVGDRFERNLSKS